MKYNINNNNLYQLFFKLEEALREDKETIKEILKIDYQYCKIKVDVEVLKEVIHKLKNEKIDLQKEQNIKIRYNGNPCITLNLSILAILTKTTISLDFNENMLGINTFIIKTINQVLNDLNTDKMIYIAEESKQNPDKIICIDDIGKYNNYLREKNAKAEFYSFNYIDFYCDSDEFENLAELIYQYAEESQISIEVYSELEVDEAVQMIKKGLGKKIALLTNNKNTQEIFQNNIKNKKLYINKNPFVEEEMMLINKEIFL